MGKNLRKERIQVEKINPKPPDSTLWQPHSHHEDTIPPFQPWPGFLWGKICPDAPWGILSLLVALGSSGLCQVQGQEKRQPHSAAAPSF